ncbi:MAG: FAD-dependent thymidylate synthase [Endomicrobiales bacterium]|nr:FAD-dependent thymidylate synthase [Endomicrobiales bacterium]
MSGEAEKLKRINVPELDAILGKPIKVLDDGFVRVIDYMGSDESIVQAARVSYGKGTKSVTDDKGLIRYLIRNRHTSPFEMCEVKMHLRVPMDCWRQWVRHRTANVNEYSTRYSVAIDSAYKTEQGRWRTQGFVNRQGSEGVLEADKGEELTRTEKELHDLSRKIYNKRLEMGVARELARKDLPLSTYTEAYWKIDLNNLLHFLELRMEPKAQHEIRMYANTINDEVVRRWCPVAWEAFNDYRLDTVFLSEADRKILLPAARGEKEKAIELAVKEEFIRKTESGYKRNVECMELEEKMKKMGLEIPWAAESK